MYWKLWINFGEWIMNTGVLGHVVLLMTLLLIFMTGSLVGRRWGIIVGTITLICAAVALTTTAANAGAYIVPTWETQMANHVNMICYEENGVLLTYQDFEFVGFGQGPDGKVTAVYKLQVDSNCNITPEEDHFWSKDADTFE